ncbi:NlpC/P60 family protein [Streptomyces tropicalis]|uniref:NlpC/P60 family protein n=1 Tax=Streptomyces tropicalis TaxID=3034234 RepID=A0ABT6AA34_9ACTN|nr:NlpC/P60 family protein [Streptomyces tropicalis]MDF3301514.1 NlpC/P60 family protein [Streptomyces tropicalis]
MAPERPSRPGGFGLPGARDFDPGAAVDDVVPSPAEVQQRISRLYDRAETATGNYNATRAMNRAQRSRTAPVPARSARSADPALDALARRWMDVARAQSGPSVAAALPPGRRPQPGDSRTALPAARTAAALPERGRELPAPARLELTAGPSDPEPVAGPTAARALVAPAGPPALPAAGTAPGADGTAGPGALPSGGTGRLPYGDATALLPGPAGTPPAGPADGLPGPVDALSTRVMEALPSGALDVPSTGRTDALATGSMDVLSTGLTGRPPSAGADPWPVVGGGAQPLAETAVWPAGAVPAPVDASAGDGGPMIVAPRPNLSAAELTEVPPTGLGAAPAALAAAAPFGGTVPGALDGTWGSTPPPVPAYAGGTGAPPGPLKSATARAVRPRSQVDRSAKERLRRQLAQSQGVLARHAAQSATRPATAAGAPSAAEPWRGTPTAPWTETPLTAGQSPLADGPVPPTAVGTPGGTVQGYGGGLPQGYDVSPGQGYGAGPTQGHGGGTAQGYDGGPARGADVTAYLDTPLYLDTVASMAAPAVPALTGGHTFTADPAFAAAPRTGAAAPAGPSGVVPAGQAERALAFARAQIGRPCVWGATGPDSYDCASLTQAAWRVAGVALPRTAQEQSALGTAVPLAELRAGDLVFFHADAGHVGICTGSGTMVHAPGPGTPIREESIFFAGAPAIRGAVRPA